MNIKHQPVTDDLKSWSREVLDIPNSHLSGLKACPYAENAWKNERVDVWVGEGPADLRSAINDLTRSLLT